MLDYISDYIKNITLFLVFITFIGIILPSNKYKNYISIVLGLILIFVIITPITSFLFGNSNSYEDFLNKLELEVNAQALDTQEQKYQNLKNDMIKQNYIELIKRQVGTIISNNNFVINDFCIDYVEETGEIKTMNITVEYIESIEEVEPTSKPFIRIEPVEVNPKLPIQITEGNNNINSELNMQYSEEIKNLKYAISDFYNLPIDNIYITVQKKN